MKISLRQVYFYAGIGSYMSFVVYSAIHSLSGSIIYTDNGFCAGSGFDKFAAVFAYINSIVVFTLVMMFAKNIMKPIRKYDRYNPIALLCRGIKKIALWNPTVVTIGKKETLPTAKVHNGNI